MTLMDNMMVAADAQTQVRYYDDISDLIQELRLHPDDLGESRAGRDRIVFHGLLIVVYRIEEASKVVYLVFVKRNGR